MVNSIKVGSSNLDAVKYGSLNVDAVYFGSSKLFPTSAPPATIPEFIGMANTTPPSASNSTLYRTLDVQSLSPQVGDLLLVFLGHDNNWVTIPSGYTKIFDQDTHVDVIIAARVVDGSESDWQIGQNSDGKFVFKSSSTSRGSVVGILLRNIQTEIENISPVVNFVTTNSSTYDFPSLPASGNTSEIVFAALVLDDDSKPIQGPLTTDNIGDLTHVGTHRSLQDTVAVWYKNHNGTIINAFSDSPENASFDQYATVMVTVS